MQTGKAEQGLGTNCAETPEHQLVELVLRATEWTEDEWELADLVEDWMQTGQLVENPAPLETSPEPVAAPTPLKPLNPLEDLVPVQPEAA